ncbi:MAG: amidohydrolase [Acidimicrobiales bacterium]|nr:amidohydrolase family protein [Hyphomonadaceae bacterium]RZV39615.1 MAG: amidohydrolase [Acidimicrobiales bacterium]
MHDYNMAMPDQIIDAHHHLWDLNEIKHTWLAEKGVVRFFGDPAPIQKNYHVPDFKDDHGELPVVGSVHIQCGVALEHNVKETEFVQRQSDAHGLANAIIAYCDLTQEGAQAELDAQQQFPNLRGVRQIVGRSAEEDAKLGTNTLLGDPAFKVGLKSLIERKLSFDLQLTPPLLYASAKLFKSIEDLPLALCHAGSPNDLSREGLKSWEAGLRDLAEHGNMICKISGLGMFDQQWTVDSFRDRVLRTIDVFGPKRIAFGSNFPVDKLYASYVDSFGAFIKLTENFSKAERDDMFFNTANNFYRTGL